MAEDGTVSQRSRDDVSTARLYLMPALYLLNVVLLGFEVWPRLIHPSQPMPLMEVVAWSFYAALSTLNRRRSDLRHHRVLDAVVIPWPYVVANYLLHPGDRWTSVPS